MTLDELTRLLNRQQPGFQGPYTPVSYSDIIGAIQGQYTPVNPAMSAVPSGAQRFINQAAIPAQAPMIEYGRQFQSAGPVYKPQDFVEQQAAQNAKSVVDAISAQPTRSSSSYSESLSAPSSVGQAGLEALGSTGTVNTLAGILGMINPAMGLMLKGATGAAEAKAANDVMTALRAYGGEPTKDASQLVGAFQSLVPFGLLGKQDAVIAAKSLAKAFENNTQLMAGYMDAATNPDIGRIVDSLAANAETGLTPAQYGAIGASVGQDIHSNIANGMSYQDAVNEVSSSYGVPSSSSSYNASSDGGGWSGTANQSFFSGTGGSGD